MTSRISPQAAAAREAARHATGEFGVQQHSAPAAIADPERLTPEEAEAAARAAEHAITGSWLLLEGARMDDASRETLRRELADFTTAYPQVVAELRDRYGDSGNFADVLGDAFGNDVVNGPRGFWTLDRDDDHGFGEAVSDLVQERHYERARHLGADGTYRVEWPGPAHRERGQATMDAIEEAVAAGRIGDRAYGSWTRTDFDSLGDFGKLTYQQQARAIALTGEPLFRRPGDDDADWIPGPDGHDTATRRFEYATGRPDEPYAVVHATATATPWDEEAGLDGDAPDRVRTDLQAEVRFYADRGCRRLVRSVALEEWDEADTHASPGDAAAWQQQRVDGFEPADIDWSRTVARPATGR